MNTKPNSEHPVGYITGNKSKTIHGWCGDMVFVLHDAENGKRAVVFEIKFGRGVITIPQKKFFVSASTECPSKFMYNLNELKVYIVKCFHLNLETNEISMRIYEYISPRLKEYYTDRKPVHQEVKITRDMYPDLAKIRKMSRTTRKQKRKKRRNRKMRNRGDRRKLRKQGRGSTRRRSMRELQHGGDFR